MRGANCLAQPLAAQAVSDRPGRRWIREHRAERARRAARAHEPGRLPALDRDRTDLDPDLLDLALPRRAWTLMPVTAKRWAWVVAIGAAACVADPYPTSWKVRRAGQLHAEGRHEEAVRLTEQ